MVDQNTKTIHLRILHVILVQFGIHQFSTKESKETSDEISWFILYKADELNTALRIN